MMKTLIPSIICMTAILAVGSELLAADKTPAVQETTTSAVARDTDIVPLHATTYTTTLIVLPEQEKALGVFCGDKNYWSVDVIPGAERFVAVKPSEKHRKTDIQIVTNLGNSYTIGAEEVSGKDIPVDLKLFIRPADESSLQKAPVFYSSTEVDALKRQLAEAQKLAEDTQKKAKTETREKTDSFRSDYPAQMRFPYKFEANKDPFNVREVWQDDKFTYIRAYPSEQPALYELKDGKPNLISYDVRENGTLYVIPKLLDTSYLQIGKKKLEIWRSKTGS